MFLRFNVFALFYLSQVYCAKTSDDTVWDSLIVTWAPPNDTNPLAFNHLPLTVSAANKQNWAKLDNGCEDKSLGFLGQRYIYNSETDFFLIFDPKGYVAGIQMALPKSIFDANGVYNATAYPPVTLNQILGKGFYVITAYFVPIEKICKGGRTADEFKMQGTLTKLWFLNGTDSLTNPVYQPLKLNNELTEKGWTKGKCVQTMGIHYYHDFPLDLDCATAFPIGLMYDNAKDNKLTGFNYLVFGDYPSNRFEYPSKPGLRIFLDPMPTCVDAAFDRAKKMTTFHIFFVSDPQTIQCPI